MYVNVSYMERHVVNPIINLSHPTSTLGNPEMGLKKSPNFSVPHIGSRTEVKYEFSNVVWPTKKGFLYIGGAPKAIEVIFVWVFLGVDSQRNFREWLGTPHLWGSTLQRCYSGVVYEIGWGFHQHQVVTQPVLVMQLPPMPWVSKQLAEMAMGWCDLSRILYGFLYERFVTSLWNHKRMMKHHFAPGSMCGIVWSWYSNRITSVH